MIASMDKNDKSYYIIDTGNSEDPLHKNYDDLIELHESGAYLEMKSGKKSLKQEEDDVFISDLLDFWAD